MTSIFVAKLDFGVSEEELRALFEEYGTVLKAHIAKDRETGKPRGFAFVEMADQEEAYAAIEGLNDHTINGRQLAVKEAEQRESNRPQTRSFEPKPARSESPGIISGDETPPQDLKDQGSKRGKKGRDTKKSGFGGGDRPRDRKMTAHKKSGKNKRIRFDDDEDEYVW